MRILIENWPRHLISIVAAILIWTLVSHSLSFSKTVGPVAVHLVNAPQGFAFAGVQQDGVFGRTLTLQVSGDRNLIESLRPSDLSVVLDASDKATEWVAQLAPADIRSSMPDLMLSRRLQLISPREVIVKMSPVISERVPVFFADPRGDAPYGYQFLDIYPRKLYVTVSGPEDQVKRIKAQGLAISIDLNTISRDELEWLEQQIGSGKDELSLPIPMRWLKVHIPFSNAPVPIDDPEATQARILFVKHQLLPLVSPLPITMFYPLPSIEEMNPQRMPLKIEAPLVDLHGVPALDRPLYVSGVSRMFLDLVRPYLTLLVTVLPSDEGLPWSVQLIDPRSLETKFLHRTLADHTPQTPREEAIRSRFRSYWRKLAIFLKPDQPLKLRIRPQQQALQFELLDCASSCPATP
ncbi:MAG: hypothetical protein ACOYKZ_01685 [Chlamydiia bacterium]